MRRSKGHICKMGTEWAVRYPEWRNIGGVLVKKKASFKLGPITTRGKRPPADIIAAAREHMKAVNGSEVPASSNVTLSAFVENVFLPDVRQHLRASTAISYESLWRLHIRAHAATDENKREVWLKNVRTFHVQAWRRMRRTPA